MFGLTANLSMAAQALEADTGAITVTNNNIANVNTPGYDRQTVNLSSVALSGSGNTQDGGVSFNGFTVVRDQLLQIGINQKTSDTSSLGTQSASWSQIESTFSNTSSGIGAAMSSFFSDISGLSTSPGDAAARQTAFSAASNLVDAFHQASSSLSAAQTGADASVTGIVTEINQLTSQIAGLNSQMATLQGSGQDGATVQNQVDQLTTQLAGLTGITSTATNSTPALATDDGSPLVAGSQSYALTTSVGSDGMNHVFNAQGQDITSQITSGSLGGTLTMRDNSIPALSSSLNALASQLATAMNSAQTQGFDQAGNAGVAMFSLPATGGAAGGLSLAMTSGSAFAASADGSTGSSGNVANLLAVQTQALPSGQSPSDTYAGFVQSIGSSSADVSSTLMATNAALGQLQSQQSSESGVSIDEETTNLLRYQQAYSAAAQVINTVNTLFTAVLNISVSS